MRLMQIEVTYEDGRMTLSEPTPDPTQPESGPLAADEDVEWQFVGLPNDCCPAIRFRVDNDDESPRGPFAFMRQTTNQVFGKGRSGTGQRHYDAVVVSTQTQEVVALRADLQIAVESAVERAGAVIVVSLGEELGELTVSEQDFSVVTGDVVVWVFEGFESIQEAWSPEVYFKTGPPGWETWPLGPFTNMTTGDAVVVGSGNTHVEGQYTYGVRIVKNETGEPILELDDDPGMGNNGDPPGGGGT